MVQSKIFARHRALGYVSNQVPLIIRYINRRRENLIVTCVGKEFHTYTSSHFTLLSVSGTHPSDINCLAGDAYHVYTASENVVYAWRRGTELKHIYKGHEHPVHSILPFGPHLITVDEGSNVKVWDIKWENIVIELNFSNKVFKLNTLVHPQTYLNKILFGSEQGQLQLWNIKCGKVIYTFKGWNKAVTALEQSPAIDVIGIGLADGRILLHNIKFDETVFELVQDWGPVISMSFRNDGYPIMATGTINGHIVFWNLEQRKVESQLHQAHYNAVTGLMYLSNEPLMVSSSADNSLKLWIFDLADGAGRLLRIREGHAEPPTVVKFYGNNGHNVLTAGGDSTIRIFSTVTEIFNKSLGKASFNRKASKKKGRLAIDTLVMPPITQLVSETTREKDWNNIAVLHSGLATITTWSYNQLKMGDKLIPERFKHKPHVSATCLCITKCGNFVLVGYNSGHVDRFNIQSGILRDSYGSEGGAHTGSIKGLMADALNQTVITGGADSLLKFWNFKTRNNKHQPRTTLHLNEPIEWIRYMTESSLIAVAQEDLGIVLVDLDTKRIVRKFYGHEGKLMDATFSPDSRWLITSSMDCTIRIWDIPSSNLIDIFQVKDPCVSLNFSPTGEFLATAHVSNIGIYLWSNRTLYSYVSLKAITNKDTVPIIDLPSSSTQPEESSDESNNPEEELEYISPAQLSENLITTSGLAQSRWQNLLSIDIIKQRNKPKDSFKVPEAAPFFLPTIPSLELKFDLSDTIKEPDSLKVTRHKDFSNLTVFGKLLHSTAANDEFTNTIEKFKSMGPSAIDFEIQSFTLDEIHSESLMLQFMKMIHCMMEDKKDFELSQAYLAVFLKCHGNVISKTKVLRSYLKNVGNVQLKNWLTIREKLFYNLSVVKNLKKM